MATYEYPMADGFAHYDVAPPPVYPLYPAHTDTFSTVSYIASKNHESAFVDQYHNRHPHPSLIPTINNTSTSTLGRPLHIDVGKPQNNKNYRDAREKILHRTLHIAIAKYFCVFLCLVQSLIALAALSRTTAKVAPATRR
jgi:hypothetical protein